MQKISDESIELENLINLDKDTCLKKLTKAPPSQIWNAFLNNQTRLFFKHEYKWLHQQVWWQKSKNILEIGSGNGSFLSLLSKKHPEKVFCGVEIRSTYVERALALYQGVNLTFQEGNAEVYDQSLAESADTIIFRATLQYIKNPLKALKHAAKYLLPAGHLLIIETFDKAHHDTPYMPAVAEAMSLAYMQNNQKNSNRRVSYELLKNIKLEENDLSEIYEIVFSNIDINENIIYETTRFKEVEDRLNYYNHVLLHLTIFQRVFGIPVNLDEVHDQLQLYLKNQKGWTRPGVHFLVLKKKE
ncbi:MAG: class I SAM-dependent methyltransferase [Chlamydiota bacterium]|nr:class I SAM-dependent methyltransferase [Chlamydiota bacterium]